MAVAGPSGCPARFAVPGGTQTRCAQTLRALFPGSAARLVLATRPRNSNHVLFCREEQRHHKNRSYCLGTEYGQNPFSLFVFHPTPADRPKGWTLLSSGGPCLSIASWSALLRLASVTCNAPDWASMVLGAFPPHNGFALRNAPRYSCALRDAPRESGAFQDAISKSSAAGAKPGNTDTR